MRELGRGLRWAVLVGLVATLAACGGAGNDAPGLSESDFLLSITGELQPNEHDALTRAWVRTLTSVNEAGGGLSAWYPGGGFAVTGDGSFNAEIDAREMAAPLEPRELAAWLFPRPAGAERIEVSRTDTEAGLKAVMWTSVYQADPATGSHNVVSHESSFYVADGVSSYYARPVFADKAVTINAKLDRPSSVSYALEASFSAGWNLMYQKLDVESMTLVYKARPLESSDAAGTFPSYSLFAQLRDLDFYGYSVFSEHQLGLGMAQSVTSDRNVVGAGWIEAPEWLGFAADNPTLAAFDEQAFGGTGTVTSDDGQAKGLLASVFVYDDSVQFSPDWWDDPSQALGRSNILSEDANVVRYIYSDRSTKLHVDLVLPGEPAQAVKTEALGLQLSQGWNCVELIPSPSEADTFILAHYTGFPTGGTVTAPL